MPTHYTLSPALRRSLSACMLACAPLTTAWASYDDGVAAYQRGRFDLAVKAFVQAAARGDARAQRSLGLLHERGEGVPRNPTLAAEWYRKAIAQGLEGAQFNLAFLTSTPAEGASASAQHATSRP